MFTKSLIAAAALAVALSGAAFGQTYQGGPKSGLTKRPQSVEANKPYAQDVGTRAGGHVYSGGPKTTIPHGR